MTLTAIKVKAWPIVRRRFRAEAAPRTLSRYAFIIDSRLCVVHRRTKVWRTRRPAPTHVIR